MPPSARRSASKGFVSGNVINNGLLATFAQQGPKRDELRKWSFRSVTHCAFTGEQFGGRLKGFSLGYAETIHDAWFG